MQPPWLRLLSLLRPHRPRMSITPCVGVACSGDNFAKAEGTVETMADGPAKFMAEREIAQAQDAMLSGKMGGCAMHLSQALRDESMTQTPYPRRCPGAVCKYGRNHAGTAATAAI